MKHSLYETETTSVLVLESLNLNYNLKPELQVILDSINKPEIIINLAKVTTVDCAICALFFALLKKMYRQKRKLVLQNLSPNVLTLFEVTRLDKVFTIT